MTGLKRMLSLFLCVVLFAATAFYTVGCGDKKDSNDAKETTAGTAEVTGEVTPPQELGEGEKRFDFTVVDGNGKETKFVIRTDKETVGEALIELKLISGDVDKYGLYVKTVNGITADYDKDKTYWGFYIDGEYALTGVDLTKIEEGKTYTFKVSK